LKSTFKEPKTLGDIEFEASEDEMVISI